jgi:hypothetical protein
MPEDTTPHGGEAFHPPPERARIPEPLPQATDTAAAGGSDTAQGLDHAAAQRPPLPNATSQLAADVEDEDADPVVESGPGAGDAGRPATVSVTQQPGG